MRELTPRDKKDIEEFKHTTGSELIELERYLSCEWEWHELWDFNFGRIDSLKFDCKCRFEGVRALRRRKGYPHSIEYLERFGCTFTLVKGGESWFVDAYYRCSCGQYWKEVFVEAMQYMGNHAYPIEQAELEQS